VPDATRAPDGAQTEPCVRTERDGGVCAPGGYRAAGVHCGIRRSHPDLALLVSDRTAAAAAVFTTNRIPAAPVLYSRRAVRDGRARAVVVNSGVANACTGPEGLRRAEETARLVARRLGCVPGEVLVASTGLIGEPLPIEAVRSGVPDLVAALERDSSAAARAILTTDRFPKRAVVERRIGDRGIAVGGIAKGAGMIHPRMATTLGFLTTDAAVAPAALRRVLRSAVDVSFNRITVDGETSTNDAVFLLANGAAGGSPLEEEGELEELRSAVAEVASRLARMVVRDGEGAERIARVHVRGAGSGSAARAVAERVAGSLLVKTALRGGDPNWGRILAAVGSAGVEVDPERLELEVGGVPLVRAGRPVPGGRSRAATAMEAVEVEIAVDLGDGTGEHWMWTSDLGEEYVNLNSRYTT